MQIQYNTINTLLKLKGKYKHSEILEIGTKGDFIDIFQAAFDSQTGPSYLDWKYPRRRLKNGNSWLAIDNILNFGA